MTPDILALLTSAANQYNVPPDLAIAVAQQESGGNPAAVSPAGAQGVMQLMPDTAASLGVTDPFDPAQNIDGGVRYLSQLLAQFGGNAQLALAAYNWGPGNVSANGFSNWPAETSNYVSSIMNQIGDALAGGPAVPNVDMSGMSLGDWQPSSAELLTLIAAGAIAFYFLIR
jgi:soluble lytic murein transglycosylase-like protein